MCVENTLTSLSPCKQNRKRGVQGNNEGRSSEPKEAHDNDFYVLCKSFKVIFKNNLSS